MEKEGAYVVPTYNGDEKGRIGDPVLQWHQQHRRKEKYHGPWFGSPGCLRMAMLISVYTGIATLAVSSWVLHRYIQAWRNPTLVTATDLLQEVNAFYGGLVGFYDLDVIYRIITACCATCLTGAIVQSMFSYWLLLASETDGKSLATVWMISHLLALLATGGSVMCILTNELLLNYSLITFLLVVGADFVLLLFYMYVVFMFMSNN